MIVFALLILGAVMRFVWHPANFTPVLALVLFGGVYFDRKYAMLFPLCLMMATDMMLGMHDMMFFTWGSMILVSFLGLWLRKSYSWPRLGLVSVTSAVLFYVVTNFGVWLSGYYPMNLKGLVDCYVLAIPFFRTMLLSTLVYSFVVFGLYEMVASRVRKTVYANAL
jgi:hypothetical protein